MEVSSDELTTLVCCICGVNIQPNPSYKCLACISQEHDMTAEIAKEISIYQCRGCERYLDPPSCWHHLPMHSKQMMAYCIKRIRSLDKYHLVKADFLYTEPHSKRLKLELTVEKMIDVGSVLEQSFVVEYIVGNQFCTDCHKVEAKDYWQAAIQLRQKIDHTRTLYYLEQLLWKNGINRNTTDVKAVDCGLDLHFSSENLAVRVLNFMQSAVVCRVSKSNKLVSHDCKSNVTNMKHTYLCELAPISKHDLLCLPKNMARTLGGISPICLVERATKFILLIDTNTAQTAEVNSLTYYQNPFPAIASAKKLEQFIVMETEETDVKYFAGQGRISQKHTVSDVWVQKVSQMGTETKYFCRTHLGGFLNIGDTVLGYDLQSCNINNDEFDKMDENKVPDVVLVKKYFGSKALRERKRKWKLKTLFDETNRNKKDYEDFLEDLEEDEKMRKNVNIYKDNDKQMKPQHEDSMEGEDPLDDDVPVIDVSEMLEELKLSHEVEMEDA